MISKATTIEDYMNQLPEDRIDAMERLRMVIKEKLPTGFQEEMRIYRIYFFTT